MTQSPCFALHDPRMTLRSLFIAASILSLLLSAGCNSQSGSAGGGKRQFISVGTAPVGGAYYTVGSAVCEVVNDSSGDLNWRVNAEATGGSMENIRLVSQGKFQFGMCNSAITYFAVRGSEGWDQAHDVRSVITLFPNLAMFATTSDSEIQSIAEMKGKRVYLGPEGAGFEFFLRPILQAHGLELSDVQAVFGNQQKSVELVGDGAVAAAIVVSGTPALSQMLQAQSMRLIPYDEEAKMALIEEYSFFQPATLPSGTYPGIDEFQGLTLGEAHLITHASVGEEVVYQFVRMVYENRDQIAQRHRAAAAMKPDTVSRPNGTDYHPGAIRYFRENDMWPTVAGE